MKTKTKIAIASAVLLMGATGALIEANDNENLTPDVSAEVVSTDQSWEEAKASYEAEKAKKAEAKALAEAERQEWANEKLSDMWTLYGVSSQAEMITSDPGHLQSYIVSAEAPSDGILVLTAQVTKDETNKAELNSTAHAILNTLGTEDETLDRVEVVTADGVARGTVNRAESELLNLGE